MIPAKIAAGDTLAARIDSPDHPAPTWTATLAIVNASAQQTATSTADGTTHVFSADTSAWAAGDYSYQLSVSDGSDRFTIQTGSIEVTPNFESGAADGRSHVKRTLDIIEAEIERRATGSKESYSLPSGRSLTLTPMPDLLALKSEYERKYRDEQNADRLAQGLGNRNRIRTRRFQATY
ncbi:MAG: hypothetical protein AAGE01_10375 [Pseudomonadota bacterium]